MQFKSHKDIIDSQRQINQDLVRICKSKIRNKCKDESPGLNVLTFKVIIPWIRLSCFKNISLSLLCPHGLYFRLNLSNR